MHPPETGELLIPLLMAFVMAITLVNFIHEVGKLRQHLVSARLGIVIPFVPLLLVPTLLVLEKGPVSTWVLVFSLLMLAQALIQGIVLFANRRYFAWATTQG